MTDRAITTTAVLVGRLAWAVRDARQSDAVLFARLRWARLRARFGGRRG